MVKRNLIKFLIIFLFLAPLGGEIFAQQEDAKTTCMVYFTGIGCPHCAKTDPVIFGELLNENPNLIIIEYEIYQQRLNAPLLYEYNSPYKTGLGIPLIIFNKEEHLIGDAPILKDIKEMVKKNDGNGCPLIDGSSSDFKELDIATLPAQPKIWTKDRILIKTGEGGDNELLRNLILTDDILAVLGKLSYNAVKPKLVPLSGRSVKFDNAAEIKNSSNGKVGWLFQWNGPSLNSAINNNSQNQIDKNSQKTELTLPKIISLAAVDAINPCALAVLILMLITIAAYNPQNKKKILLAGLAFTASVFVMYLVYGFIIVKFFQIIQALTTVRLVLYKILGLAAIILGILNLKDFIKYKPGGFGTEMPMFMRPKLNKIVSSVTSPSGAFLVGAFVTLFLLPCTIGPYIIAGGILSVLEFIKIIPWLLIYNLIFVLPMLIITGVIYFGFAKIEDVSGWRKKNIKYLHLAAGLIILGLGMAMVFGWV